MAPAAIVLKFTLRELRPPVWRRVRVPADITLRRLHQVIQAAGLAGLPPARVRDR